MPVCRDARRNGFGKLSQRRRGTFRRELAVRCICATSSLLQWCLATAGHGPREPHLIIAETRRTK